MQVWSHTLTLSILEVKKKKKKNLHHTLRKNYITPVLFMLNSYAA
jgi:hypothetical protein